ncbi:MAG: hypothetical protein EOO66_32275, partial [Methylobacterium sp.]
MGGFNTCDPAAAAVLLRPCLDVNRWIDEIVDARPYASVDDLFAAARGAANPFTGAELEAALVHHPRIGEQSRGASPEAGLSRSEQAALDLDADVQRRLVEGNQAYERRFGRVFLIRAAGLFPDARVVGQGRFELRPGERVRGAAGRGEQVVD